MSEEIPTPALFTPHDSHERLMYDKDDPMAIFEEYLGQVEADDPKWFITNVDNEIRHSFVLPKADAVCCVNCGSNNGTQCVQDEQLVFATNEQERVIITFTDVAHFDCHDCTATTFPPLQSSFVARMSRSLKRNNASLFAMYVFAGE